MMVDNEWATLKLEASELIALMWALEVAIDAANAQGGMAAYHVDDAMAIHNRVQSAWMGMRAQ